jgi:hypothetical protein
VDQIHWHLSEISLTAYTSTFNPESIQTAVAFIEGSYHKKKILHLWTAAFSIRIQMPNFWRGRNFTSNGHSYSSLGLQLRLLTRRHGVIAKIWSIRASMSQFNSFFSFLERSWQVGHVCFWVPMFHLLTIWCNWTEFYMRYLWQLVSDLSKRNFFLKNLTI